MVTSNLDTFRRQLHKYEINTNVMFKLRSLQRISESLIGRCKMSECRILRDESRKFYALRCHCQKKHIIT